MLNKHVVLSRWVARLLTLFVVATHVILRNELLTMADC